MWCKQKAWWVLYPKTKSCLLPNLEFYKWALKTLSILTFFITIPISFFILIDWSACSKSISFCSLLTLRLQMNVHLAAALTWLSNQLAYFPAIPHQRALQKPADPLPNCLAFLFRNVAISRCNKGGCDCNYRFLWMLLIGRFKGVTGGRK